MDGFPEICCSLIYSVAFIESTSRASMFAPKPKAEPTELVSTMVCHVNAASIFLYSRSTFWTLVGIISHPAVAFFTFLLSSFLAS